jgi:hypothetical protein
VPVDGSVYMGICYNQSSSTESEDPSQYNWTKIKGTDAVQYYTWMKYSTTDTPTVDEMYDDPTENNCEYIGIAYNQTSETELLDPSLYTWTKFVGPMGITGPQGWTWIKYATGPNPTTDQMYEDPDEPYVCDYIGMAFNQAEQTESSNPTDYKWTKYKGPTGLKGETGASGIGGLSIVVANTNFSFISDYDGIITEATYSTATTPIMILDGASTALYSSTLIGPTNYSYTTDGEYTYIITDNNTLIQLDESAVYELLNTSEWVVYSAKCIDISISDLSKVVEPSSNKEYADTVHPTDMTSDVDSASILYTILGKNSKGEEFKLTTLLYFSKSSVGPGVVYRGPFDNTKEYYSTAKRKDVVYYATTDHNYWMASSQLLSGATGWSTPGEDDMWTSFGAEFSSIATGVIISEESYVKNTLNIGTNSNNTDANMTLYGGDDYPFMAIGQSGADMAWGATGIWLGVYSKDTDGDGVGDTKGHALSIGDQTNSFRWDGENLIVIGGIKQYDTTADYGQDNPVGWVASTKYVDDNVAYTVQILSTNGNIFKNNEISTTLSAIVKKGNNDVTSDINATEFNWVRISSDTNSDTAWNNDISHKGTKSIIVTDYDVINKATFDCIVNLPST